MTLAHPHMRPAEAQSTLPDTILQAQPPTAQDEAAVRRYIEGPLKSLIHGDPAEAQSARDRLAAPVLRTTSVAFRIFYSQQVLTQSLELLIIGPQSDPQRAQLALSVAGAIATDAGLMLLKQGLDDPRIPVRFGAARELGVLLSQLDKDQSAIQQARIPGLIESLKMALSNEANFFVASELAKALVAPVIKPSIVVPSLTAMCQGMADQISRRQPTADVAPDPYEQVVVILRANKDAQERLIQREILGDVPKELKDAAARFAAAAGEFAATVSTNRALGADGHTLNERLIAVAKNLRELSTGLRR